jgi:hypothetical protein
MQTCAVQRKDPKTTKTFAPVGFSDVPKAG